MKFILIKLLIRQQIKCKKEGKEVFNDKRDFTNDEPNCPLRVVAFYHSLLDVYILDDKSGTIGGRPWLTVAIDLYSRMVLGADVSLEYPSTEVLRNSVLFKKVKGEGYTIINYGIDGIPEILLDNVTEGVERMYIETLGIKARVGTANTSRNKATVERLFEETNAKQLYRSACVERRNNPLKFKDYVLDNGDELTLDNTKELLTTYLTDIHSDSEQEALPSTVDFPIARYKDGFKMVDYPKYISEELCKMELLHQTMKLYTCDGIQLNNINYRAEELEPLLEGKTVKVYFDKYDLSCIYIQNPVSFEFLKVLAV